MLIREMVDEILEARKESDDSKLVRKERKVALDKIKLKLDREKETYDRADKMKKGKFKKDTKNISSAAKRLRPPK